MYIFDIGKRIRPIDRRRDRHNAIGISRHSGCLEGGRVNSGIKSVAAVQCVIASSPNDDIRSCIAPGHLVSRG